MAFNFKSMPGCSFGSNEFTTGYGASGEHEIFCTAASNKSEFSQVLLVSVNNMIYPVTESELHQVFSHYGYVENIIITSTTSYGLQVLIQFHSYNCAIQAKNHLHGRNIYNGCCQLDIQYLRSDSSFNFRSGFKPDFTSNEFIACSIPSTDFSLNEPAASFEVPVGYVKFGNSVISKSDLNFIKNGFRQMIESVNRVQDRLEALNSSLQNCIHTLSKSSRAASSISFISPTKSKVRNDADLDVLTTPEIHMENCLVIIEDEKKLSTNLELHEQVLKGLDYKTCFEFPLQYGYNIHDYTSKATLKPIDLESTFCLFNGDVKTECGKKKSVVAYNLFDKMFANELNLYKLPWPPSPFEYVRCSTVAYVIHDNFLLYSNIVYQCCIFVFDPGGCIDVLNELALKFNNAVKVLMHNLSSRMVPMKYSIGSSHAVVSNIMKNPHALGFKEAKTACCGSGKFNAQLACMPNATLCSDRRGYLFWDMLHPTHATSKLAGFAIYNGSLEFATPINFRQLVHEADVPAVYVFGDSTADVGNNNFSKTQSKADFPHYGIDFPLSRATGRFSNDYNGIDFLAKYMGFRRSPRPFLSVANKISQQITKALKGISFASGGSGILDSTGNTITLRQQIQHFTTVKSILSTTMRHVTRSYVMFMFLHSTLGTRSFLRRVDCYMSIMAEELSVHDTSAQVIHKQINEQLPEAGGEGAVIKAPAYEDRAVHPKCLPMREGQLG